MTQVNKYGLKRSVDSDIRRTIRQQCGFGCVICGNGIYEYEHVDPEFSEAKEHDPSNMTLLCHQCHGKVTRKILSKETIKNAMLNPFCKKIGYSNEFFDFGNNFPLILFGSNQFSNCQILIQVYGDSILEIKPPEEPGSPFRLSGIFNDSQEKKTLQIIENEWIAQSDNWDIEISGPIITIRERKGKINLRLISSPPKGLIIDKINMQYKGVKFSGNQKSIDIVLPDGRIRNIKGNNYLNGYPIAVSIGLPKNNISAALRF